MLRELQLLRELDGADLRLLGAALGWVLVARAVLLAPGDSFLTKRRALDVLAGGLPRAPLGSISAACWAVTAASKRVPGTRCLAWALALRGLLLQGGRRCELRIGVAPRRGAALEAHAWIECEGQNLTWNTPVEGYAVLGRRGETT